MQHLLSNLDALREQLKKEHLFLFLDYDGTLVDIAEKPELAILPQECKDLLCCISRYSKCQVAFISGRDIDDLKNNIGLDDVIYAGSHGYEISGNGFDYRHPLPFEYKAVLAEIKGELISKMAGIANAHLEDKNISLSLHYRMCNESEAVAIADHFDCTVWAALNKKVIRVLSGKKVLEILPSCNWSKGEAAWWLLNKRPAASFSGTALPIYIGDDHTDESAFEKLGDYGITIYVGTARESKAKYYAEDVKEVYQFLKYLHACLQCSGAKSFPNVRLCWSARKA